jgi:hypothetical protein
MGASSNPSETRGFTKLLPAWAIIHFGSIFLTLLSVLLTAAPLLVIVTLRYPDLIPYLVVAAFGSGIMSGTRIAARMWEDPVKTKKEATTERFSLAQAIAYFITSLLFVSSILIFGTMIGLVVNSFVEAGLLATLLYPYIEAQMAERLGTSPGLIIILVFLKCLNTVQSTITIDGDHFTRFLSGSARTN